MTERKETTAKKIRNILVPFLLYYIVHDLAQVLLAFLLHVSLNAFGTGYGEFMMGHVASVNGVLNVLSLLIGMAAVYPMAKAELLMAASDRTKGDGEQEEGESWQQKLLSYLPLVFFSVFLAMGLNILLTLTGFTQSSEAYREVAERQHSVALPAGILIYGFLSPIAEEVVFRGLIYHRLKRYFNAFSAIFVCGILFGIYHGNLVQGIYGCIVGIAISFVYEWYGSFSAPVLFHALANISVFLAGYIRGAGEALLTPLNCVAFMTISICSLFFMIKMRKKQK